MINFIYKAKIKTVISITITFLSLIILIQGALAVYNVYDSRKQALHMASLIISEDTKNMSELFERIDSLTNIMETDKSFVYSPANTVTNDIIEDSKRFNELHERFQSMVSNSVMDASFFNSFLFLRDDLPLAYIAPDFSKEINLSINVSAANVYSLSSIKSSPWLDRLNDSTDYIIWTSEANNRPTLCYAKKIYMHIVEQNQLVLHPMGVFYVSYDLSALLNQLELTDIYPTSAITLLYNDEIIYETKPSAGYNKSGYSSYTSSIYPGLTLITSISHQDISSPYTRQLIIGIIVFFFAMLFGILVLSYINNAVVYPITYMAKHLLADEGSTLSYDKKLNPEIDILYKNHNYMVEHTKQAMDERRKSYYKMLQAQINPHFTYNVLNSISAISLMKGDFEIAQTLSNLVVMLRYGINSPDTLVDLEKEIEIIQTFVSIQNFRYDNKINIEYDIPEYLLKTKMPKLTLQPLVENSIFHSDKSLAESDINIKLTASCVVDKVIIKIHDNNSADPSVLNSHLTSTDEDFTKNRRGIGIRNINQRLAFVFGEGYGLHYTSDNAGLCSIVTLPKKNS